MCNTLILNISEERNLLECVPVTISAPGKRDGHRWRMSPNYCYNTCAAPLFLTTYVTVFRAKSIVSTPFTFFRRADHFVMQNSECCLSRQLLSLWLFKIQNFRVESNKCAKLTSDELSEFDLYTFDFKYCTRKKSPEMCSRNYISRRNAKCP